ncbi:hypothetical protein PMAYCL1PPCAC_33033, partial [Pristionchus mayeri]
RHLGCHRCLLQMSEYPCNSSIPCLYQTDDYPLYYIPYQFPSFIGPERWWVENEKRTHSFIWRNWHYTVWIAVIYAAGVHILQRAMLHRKAFDLRGPMILWNGALALFSLFGTIRMAEEFVYVISTRPLLDSISYTYDPGQPGAFWAVLFAVSKLFELGDTAFVILRKKQLIFLHWYHHAIVLVYVWHAAREVVAGGRYFILMNYAVHTLMYAYYAVSAAGFRLPRFISMGITTMQTVQMLVGVAISFIVLYYKLQGRLMQQSFENLYFCFAIYVSFAFLFMNFFSKSYMGKKEQKDKVE